jgi:Lrp/AsnC family leucine-responsive transcriptional regulator
MSNGESRIDPIDAEILRALQSNARMRHSVLAKQVGLAQSTVLERVRRLEEQGYVKGYQAKIDAHKLGLNIQAFVSVTLNKHEKGIIKQFEEGVRQLSCVRTCYHLTGRFDYLLHVAVKDLEALGTIVKSQIAALPGFGKSETFVIFSEIKTDAGWPVEENLGPRALKKNKR